MSQDILSTFSLTFEIFGFLFSLAPFWLPVVLGATFWYLWMVYIQTAHIAEIEWVLLGIRIPKTIMKTPLSMELVLAALHQSSGGNWLKRHWAGKVVAWFSLELVSLGGNIHFFIRTPVSYKNFIEAQLYSQYPGIEIYEAEDYTKHADYKTGETEWEMWGTEFALTKPDPYPIKTYVDYKLDQAPKKEEELASITDPIAPTVEFLGSIGAGEQIWIQILVRATGKRFNDPSSRFGDKRDWKAEAKDIVAKLRSKGEDEKISKSEQEAIAAIEREVSKLGFDCGIRAVYVAKKEHFHGSATGGIRGAFTHYNSVALNGFRPVGETEEEYPFKNYTYDIGNLEFDSVEKLKRKMWSAYIARGYFYAPHKNKRKPFILNTEELATIFHFPSGMTETPGFTTIQSRKAEPPANLPI